MSAVDLVISDVDGTLVLPGKHNPTIAVRKALADLQIAGIILASATGRPYGMARDLFLDAGIKDACIFDNGATIRDVKTGKIIWKNWLEVDRLRQIFEVIAPAATLIDFFPEWRELDPKKVTANDIVEEAPYGFALVKSEAAEHIESELKKIGGLNIFVGQSYESIDLKGIQITDQASSKFHAVNKLRELVHDSKSQVLSIGDGPNDLPLFEAAGVKVAMGNAVDELKARADYVVAPVEQDGFAEAMQRFVLN